MKASLEAKKTEYRGVVLESETPEEKEVLNRIWSGHGRPVEIARLLNNQVKLVIAPTPQGGESQVSSVSTGEGWQGALSDREEK